MNIPPRFLCIFALAGIALMGAGCDQRQSAETAGRKVDRAAATAGQKMEGAAEKAGQKLDRAADQAASATKDATAKATSAIEDAALTAKVKGALFAEPGLKTLQLDVETTSGVVTLAGSVDSEELHRRAVQIAGAMNGVSQVVDKLVVKS